MELLEYLKTNIRDDGLRAIPLVLSPTMLHASYCKFRLNGQKDQIREFIIRKNWQYFLFTPFLAVLSLVFGTDLGFFETLIFLPIFIYAFSRINEIFVAFIRDAHSHLSSEPSSSLKYHERIPLALRSYAELIILFGLIYFGLNCWSAALSCGLPDCRCRASIWESVYFSGVTITTLGYGEITPRNFWSQLFTIYEVLCGFTLIVVSFTVYVSKSIADDNKQP